jgi:hypothetical protein
MTLEQLKVKAKESLSTIDTFNGAKVRAILEHNYEELIDSTHQTTVEEIIKIAEGMKGGVEDIKIPSPPYNTLADKVCFKNGYNQAFIDLIKAIKK